MLKGTRDAVVQDLRSVSIHGQVSWEITFAFLDQPDGPLNAARVGPEAIEGGPLHVGDHIRVAFLMGVIVGVSSISLSADRAADAGQGPSQG
jgi:hypothetical protein